MTLLLLSLLTWFSVSLGKYHSTSAPKTVNGQGAFHTEDETTEQILQQQISAAGILCRVKIHHAIQASNLPLTKDVLGIVATLARVENENLSRLVFFHSLLFYLFGMKSLEGHASFAHGIICISPIGYIDMPYMIGYGSLWNFVVLFFFFFL